MEQVGDLLRRMHPHGARDDVSAKLVNGPNLSNFTAFAKLFCQTFVKPVNLFVKLPDLSNVTKLVNSVQLVNLPLPSEKRTTEKATKFFA